MKIKNYLFHLISENKIKEFIYLIENKYKNEQELIDFSFKQSTILFNFDFLKYLLQHDLIKSTINSAQIEDVFFDACQNGNFYCSKYLIETYNLNPSAYSNQAFYLAYIIQKESEEQNKEKEKLEAEDILNYLWKDKRVRDSLKEDHPTLHKIQKIKSLQNKIYHFTK